MKPLIKWPGGKSSELAHIKRLIPRFDRYFEPFLGGGALFFHLEPLQAVINDLSADLMHFYSSLQDERQRAALRRELDGYVRHWERISTYMKEFGRSFLGLYERYRAHRLDDEQLAAEVAELFEDRIVPFNGLFREDFCLDQEGLLRRIERSVIAKLRRTKHKVDVHNGFSQHEVMKNVETAFRSGFYTHFRDVMNRSRRGDIRLTDAKRVANYYFVREFCYGSMFRFNSAGDFNIPYGGMAYNRKDFRAKVARLFSDRVRRLLSAAVIENVDFEELLARHPPGPRDFIFFDPPYDTEFSEYEENAFTKQDQQRLAESVLGLPCPFILIIKETPLIRSLYDNEDARRRGVRMEGFEKKYNYNVKGRNTRDTTHLIIHNLSRAKQPTLSTFA